MYFKSLFNDPDSSHLKHLKFPQSRLTVSFWRFSPWSQYGQFALSRSGLPDTCWQLVRPDIKKCDMSVRCLDITLVYKICFLEYKTMHQIFNTSHSITKMADILRCTRIYCHCQGFNIIDRNYEIFIYCQNIRK